ncbi:hypothetical protein GBAR_LOCUS24564 [Geodia barretti]|uniref:Uncharacterized protein n=1 Tax=Geodia barretti TaxID=519541 RepID=A0AA35T9K2_GEOBA|nr:hypothetical protein GBAR_LOCUS24564 [Geodia barretti]
MAFRFLLLCLACVHLGLTAPFGDDGREIVRSKRRSPSPAPPTPFPEVLVDFSVRRLGKDLMEMFDVQEDPFCDEGLDAPGNITIHTFYRDRLEDDADGVGNWTFLQRNSAQIEFDSTLNISLAVPLKGEAVQLAVLQLDHAGSHCQPWSIGHTDLLIKVPNATVPLNFLASTVSCTRSEIQDSGATFFVRGSGSSLRGFITEWMTSDEVRDGDCLETGESLEKTFFLPDLSPPHIELCSLDSQPNTPYLDLSFLIRWSYAASCNNINNVDEGIELSVRRKGDQLWTPLAFFARNENQQTKYGIDLDYDTDSDTVHIRGFSVPVTINDTDVQHNMTFRICSEAVLGSRGVQFRWLQTAQHFNDGFRDTWSLDDVSVSVTHDSSCSEVVFFDDFENEGDSFTVCIFASSVQWTASRRARINEDSDICNDGRNGSAAWFGDYPLVSPETRMIATRLIRLERDVVCPLMVSPLPQSPQLFMSLDEELMAIFLLLYSDVEVGMSQLEDYLDAEAAETVNETQVVYLTTVILDIFGEAPVSRNLSQSFVNIAGQLISAVSSRPEPQER